MQFIKYLVVALSAALFWSPAMAEEVHWIDVRSPAEYAGGHVEGAVNIPHTEIAERIAEITENKDAIIHLYCRSGRRSGIAQEALKKLGYSEAVNDGGYEEVLKRLH